MTINNKSERNYRGKCLGSPVTSYGGGKDQDNTIVANEEILTFDIVSKAFLEGVISVMRLLLFCTGQQAWKGKNVRKFSAIRRFWILKRNGSCELAVYRCWTSWIRRYRRFLLKNIYIGAPCIVLSKEFLILFLAAITSLKVQNKKRASLWK